MHSQVEQELAQYHVTATDTPKPPSAATKSYADAASAIVGKCREYLKLSCHILCERVRKTLPLELRDMIWKHLFPSCNRVFINEGYRLPHLPPILQGTSARVQRDIYQSYVRHSTFDFATMDSISDFLCRTRAMALNPATPRQASAYTFKKSLLRIGLEKCMI